ncbi:MAG: methionine--tRNA ligase subunit beta [Candidatus Bathyarchaeota archaeon]|nr:methionine--tRNA ligase subunit beta [Candidatus Bathyarchaeota archaeon]
MSTEVSYRDFKKLDIHIGTIAEIEKVKGSDKLYKIQVDMGDHTRQILSSLVDYYTEEQMQGKVIAIVCNMKPAKMFGHVSNGMLLAAETNEGDLALLTTDQSIANGAKIT